MTGAAHRRGERFRSFQAVRNARSGSERCSRTLRVLVGVIRGERKDGKQKRDVMGVERESEREEGQ